MPTPEEQVQEFAANIPTVYTVLNDENDFLAATDLLQDIVRRRKELDDLRKSITRPIDDAKKKVMDLFRPVEQQVSDSERMLKRAISDWDALQTVKRIEQEQRLRAEYDQSKASYEAQAQHLRKQGEYDAANEVEALIPSVPVVVENRPKTSVSIRSTWKAIPPKTNQEMIALLDYVIRNDMWNLIMVNQSALDALARSMRGNGKVPGVEFYAEKTVASR